MAEDRKIWPTIGMDAKVSALSDLEFRVWVQYVLSANDLGVMPMSAAILQGANRALGLRPRKAIDKALQILVHVGLLCTFDAEGSSFVWCAKWQDWQWIRHPRRTSLPLPQDLSGASEATREHFRKYLQNTGSVSESFQKSSGDISASRAARADARAGNPHPNPTPTGDLSDPEESARETHAATNHGGTYRPVNPHSKPTNLVHGGEQRRHGTHAWCDPERGKCVPFGLHDEFCKALGVPRDEAESRLKAWYPTVIAGYAGVPIGDDAYALWRNEFAAWVGTVSRKPVATESTREGRTLAAAARTTAALERGEL